MPDDKLPVEIAVDKARADILSMLNTIAQKYSLPSSMITLILESLLNSIKITTYENILATYKLVNPNQPQPTQPVTPTVPKAEPKEDDEQ